MNPRPTDAPETLAKPCPLFPAPPDRKDGGFVVTCRDLPEAITQGNTVEGALTDVLRIPDQRDRGFRANVTGHSGAT